MKLYHGSTVIVDKTTALQRLKSEIPNNQICFINQKVLEEVLCFESSYEAKGVES